VVRQRETRTGCESNAGFEYFNPSLQSLRERLAIQHQTYLIKASAEAGVVVASVVAARAAAVSSF